MSDIRLKRITIDSHDYPLIIQNGVVNITSTLSSESSITGALVVDGGISIKSTQTANSPTAGGGLTVNGGLGVLKNVKLGQDLNLTSATGVFQIDGLSTPRFLVDSVVNKQIVMRPDGVNTRFHLSDTSLNINITKSSTNSSTGAFVVAGGVSIESTEDSSSITSGGGLTVSGGGSFGKSLHIGECAQAKDIVLLNTEDDPSSSTLSFYKSRNETNTQQSDSFGGITWYGFANGAYCETGSLSMEQSTAGNSFASGKFSLNITHPTGDSKDHIVVNGENDGLSIHSNSVFLTSTHESALHVDGGATISKQLVLDNGIDSSYNANTIGSIVTTAGNVGINTSNPDYDLDVNGVINATGFTGDNISLSGLANIPHVQCISLTSANIIISDNISSSNINITNASVSNLYSDDASLSGLESLNITSTNVITTNFTSQNIEVSSAFISNLQTTSHSSSSLITNTFTTNTFEATGHVRILADSNTIGNITTTNGNVGVNNVIPQMTLDVNGTLHVNDIVTFSNSTPSTDSSTGTLLINGGLSICNSSNATSLTCGGTITTDGGASVGQDVYIGGITYFKNTTPSTSYSDASVHIAGGLSISQNQNVANVGNGGALTVAGGASIGLDLYVGGEINGSGSSSSSFAYLTLTATDEAVNLTSGSLITFGGVTIQATTNATSLSNGGSLLVNGGASFNGDTYFSGSQYLYNPSNYFSPTNDVINMYDNMMIKRISLDLDTSSHNFSVSRYDGLGNFEELVFDISNATGTMHFYNTTPSSSVNASISIDGGVSINCTHTASSIDNGGALSIHGGISVHKNVLIGGDTHILSTTPSSNVSTGAFLVDGGVGITGNLNVLGNTILNGDLTVRGTTTSVISNNTVIGDNVLVLNSGPSGSKDSGVLIQRYQADNDSGTGDVVTDQDYLSTALPIQGSIQTNEIKFDSTLSAVDNFYNGWWIKISSGFSNNQVRKVISYNGAQRVATVSSPWQSQNPSHGDSVYLYNKPFVGIKYNEINDCFEFGGSASDDFNAVTNMIPVIFHSATSTSTQVCENPTSGSLKCSGGLLVSNTTDATSTTSGGSFMSLGGGSFSKTLHVGNTLVVSGVNMTPNTGDLFAPVTFQAQNNQNTFVDIEGVSFDSNVWGVDIYLAACLVADSNLYANFHIRAINKGDSWETVKTYVGDDMGIEFQLSNSGQLQYTSYEYTGFVTLTFKCRALVN
jgi:hypothetical protein